MALPEPCVQSIEEKTRKGTTGKSRNTWAIWPIPVIKKQLPQFTEPKYLSDNSYASCGTPIISDA